MSWNVNGIRACYKKGFHTFLEDCGADVLGLQEVRARPDQVPAELLGDENWETRFIAAERAGYSGVGLFCRQAPDELETSLGRPEFDAEGRVQIARFGSMYVANVYFPNGGGKNRDNSRIPFKLDFYRTLFDRLESLRAAGAPVVVIGDFNTAHTEIDLARPKQNHKTSGFCPEEREELDRWLNNGWVDTFRVAHPGEPEHFTWWSNFRGARSRNIGWRIDYCLASESAAVAVSDAFILPDIMGSDHCPVGVEIDVARL